MTVRCGYISLALNINLYLGDCGIFCIIFGTPWTDAEKEKNFVIVWWSFETFVNRNFGLLSIFELGEGGGGGGVPNPISQQIVFFKSQLKSPQSQPVLLKSKSHSHFSIVFVS